MSWLKNISDIRRDYINSKLDEDSLQSDPLNQFELWFDDARSAGFIDSNAMVLSTVGMDGRPSSRMVLLKQFNQTGYYFFTNYESRKGKDLESNPYACLLLFWDKLERQVRIEGKVEKVSREESENYFITRPYESRIGAWASRQSATLKSRFSLLREVAKLVIRYPKNVPLPEHWGGYRLVPDRYEFWQGRASRLHDRFIYISAEGGWEISRLYP